MSSKTTTGRGPSSKSLSGEDSSTGPAGPAGPPGPTGPAGPPGTGLAGGVAGNVPYQTAPGTTSYITNGDGVMQMVSNVPAWTDSTTTLKRVTAPTANDLDLVSSGAAKKIKLSTNAGEITLSADNGTTQALTVKTDSTLKTLINNASFLKTDATGIIGAGTGGLPSSSMLGGAARQVLYQSAPNVTAFSNDVPGILQNDGTNVSFTNSPTTVQTITAPAAQDLVLSNPTAANLVRIQSAGTIKLNTANGVLPSAWSIAQTTGVLSNGLNSADIVLTQGGISTAYDGGQISTSAGNFTALTTTAASTYRVMTNGY